MQPTAQAVGEVGKNIERKRGERNESQIDFLSWVAHSRVLCKDGAMLLAVNRGFVCLATLEFSAWKRRLCNLHGLPPLQSKNRKGGLPALDSSIPHRLPFPILSFLASETSRTVGAAGDPALGAER